MNIACPRPMIGLEIEAYLMLGDKHYLGLPKEMSLIGQIIGPRWDNEGFSILEAKTDCPGDDVNAVVHRTLENLREGLKVYSRLFSETGLSYKADSRLSSTLEEGDIGGTSDEIGTHCHVDTQEGWEWFQATTHGADHCKDSFKSALAWNMRKKLWTTEIVGQFCYSPRLARRDTYEGLSGEEFISLVGDKSTARMTIIYREDYGTVEVLFPDSTDDPRVLKNLGTLIQNTLMASLEDIARDPQKAYCIPDEGARYREMQSRWNDIQRMLLLRALHYKS